MRAFGKPPRILRIAPQQHPRRAAVPQPPVHLVALRIAQQVRIAVAAVELVLPVDVRGMERQAHLLHPVLGRDPQVARPAPGRLRSPNQAAPWPGHRSARAAPAAFIIWKTFRQNASCSPFFRPDSSCMRNWMASTAGTRRTNLRQRRLGVRRQVLLRHAPDQAGRRLRRDLLGSRNAAALARRRDRYGPRCRR